MHCSRTLQWRVRPLDRGSDHTTCTQAHPRNVPWSKRPLCVLDLTKDAGFVHHYRTLLWQALQLDHLTEVVTTLCVSKLSPEMFPGLNSPLWLCSLSDSTRDANPERRPAARQHGGPETDVVPSAGWGNRHRTSIDVCSWGSAGGRFLILLGVWVKNGQHGSTSFLPIRFRLRKTDKQYAWMPASYPALGKFQDRLQGLLLRNTDSDKQHTLVS